MKGKDTLKTVVIIMVTLAMCFMAGCRISETPADILNHAEQMIEKKDNKTAISILRPFVYYHQDNYKAHILMGQAFLNAEIENDKSLYIARYYFNKARDLAETEVQREKAALMYADVKMLMGKGNQSGEVLLKTAARAGTMGRKIQAARLSVQAASQFIEAGEYEIAQEACQTGLKYAETENHKFDLQLGLATAFFLDNKYQQSYDSFKSLPLISHPNHRITSLDPFFLDNAVNIMMLKSKRHTIMRWKKKFDEDTEKQFISNFKSMTNYIETNRSLLDKKKAKLVAESCQIIAEYAEDNNMLPQARTAYEFAGSFFGIAGLAEKAKEVADEKEDLDS